MTIIICQWINFIGNSHHFHEYRWIIFHFTFIVHIYTVLFIILLNTSDNLFYVCVVNICCEYTCKIYVQCAMLLCKNHAAEEFPCWVRTQICKCFMNYSAILLLTITTRQQGLLNDRCMGAVRFCGWCCWMLHVLTGTLCCRTQRLHYTPCAQGQPRSWSNHLPPEPLHFTPSPTWNADESSGVNSQWQYFFWHRVS